MVKAVDDADPAVKLPALQTLAEGGAAAVPVPSSGSVIRKGAIGRRWCWPRWGRRPRNC